jgi:hypothetical protein
MALRKEEERKRITTWEYMVGWKKRWVKNKQKKH